MYDINDVPLEITVPNFNDNSNDDKIDNDNNRISRRLTNGRRYRS
jgi:hypothetical protein